MADLITPRTLSGFRDRLPKEAMAKEKLLQKLSSVFESFGFAPIETPHLEYADILIQHGSDEIQKELYRFKDHGGRDVVLRFDQTVPLARFISQYRNELDLPFKRFAIGNVFRGERAQRGRYREFTQCDFDFIGSDSIACDAEIIQVIYASLAALEIDEFSIWVNHRSILNGICEHFGIAQVEDFLRSIDKLDKIGKDGVAKELESLIPSEKIPASKIEEILQIITMRQVVSIDEFLESVAYMKDWNEQLRKGLGELEEMFGILRELEMDSSKVRINFAIARGLGYYTGIVYETTLDRLKNIGSVCSGGRYDNLTKSFSKEPLSGVGASIGLDRLLAALEELGLVLGASTSARVLIACMDKGYFGFAHKVAESFRRSGIYTEVYPEPQKLKKQLSYANNKGHEYCLIIGENEFNTHTFTLKNMTTGMQLERLSFLRALEIMRD